MITKFDIFENYNETVIKIDPNAVYFGYFLCDFLKKYFNDDNINYRIDTRRFRKDNDIIIEEYLKICLDKYCANHNIKIDILPGKKLRYLSSPNMFDKKFIKINDDLIELSKKYTTDILKNHFVIDIDKIDELKNDILLYKETSKYNL